MNQFPQFFSINFSVVSKQSVGKVKTCFLNGWEQNKNRIHMPLE